MTRTSHRQLLAAALCILAAPTVASAQSLWPGDGRRGHLLADTTARQKGDIITVLIRESQKTDQTESQELTQETSLSAVLKTLDLKPGMLSTLPKAEASSTRSFKGDGTLASERTIEARITALVVDVMPNGNLVIEGRRTVQVDDEVKRMVISGLVRQQDITSSNTVLSENIAEATVRIEGSGPLHRAANRGLVGEIFDAIWHNLWPF